MQKRRSLEKSDISIAPLVFGGNVFEWTKKSLFPFLKTVLNPQKNAEKQPLNKSGNEDE